PKIGSNESMDHCVASWTTLAAVSASAPKPRNSTASAHPWRALVAPAKVNSAAAEGEINSANRRLASTASVSNSPRPKSRRISKITQPRITTARSKSTQESGINLSSSDPLGKSKGKGQKSKGKSTKGD